MKIDLADPVARQSSAWTGSICYAHAVPRGPLPIPQVEKPLIEQLEDLVARFARSGKPFDLLVADVISAVARDARWVHAQTVDELYTRLQEVERRREELLQECFMIRAEQLGRQHHG